MGGQLGHGGNDYGGKTNVFLSFFDVHQSALLYRGHSPSQLINSYNFDSLVSITYFSALPSAVMRRPAVGLNQMSEVFGTFPYIAIFLKALH